jgi:hypothetical protein
VDDFLAYKLGMEGRSLGDMLKGNMDDDKAYGGMRYRAHNGDLYTRYRDDLRSARQQWSLSTSFNLIPDPMGLSLSPVQLAWERRYSVRPDPLWIDTSVVWPKLTVSATSKLLERLGIVKKAMSSVSLQSSYSFERSSSQKGTAFMSGGKPVLPPSATDTTLKHTWGPIVKVDGTVRKYPIRLRYEHRYDSDLRKSEKWSKTKKHSDNAGLDYEIRKSEKERAIKIFKWKIPIKGRLSMGMTVDRAHETSYLDRPPQLDTATGEVSEPDVANEPTSEVKEYSLKPNLKYEFTNNVDALLQYTGALKNEVVADRKTYTHLIELIINIRF